MPRSVKFRDILWGVATRMGMDPESGLNANDARAITEYINLAWRIAAKHYPWPETTFSEERTASGQIIAWAQSGETVIGDVLGVFQYDPLDYDNPEPIGFRTTSAGIVLPERWVDGDVWILFREPTTPFTATTWTAGVYAIGDTVYYPTTGHCYICIAVTTNQAPTNTSYWETLPVPDFLAEAIKAGAYAATLSEEGQHGTATLAGAAMAELLAIEVDLVENQSQQNQFIRVGVRVPPT